MSKLLDPDWRWLHGLYKIRSEDGIVPIRLRPEQRVLHDLVYPAYLARRKLDVIILKDRQRGTSTHVNLICLDCTAYFPGRVANTLADTRERAASMFDNNVKLAFDNIPEGLRPHAERDNVNELVFDRIGSKYIISASKSEPVDLLHVSEAPYFLHEERITEAEQMLRRHGIEIMESTAFGVGNLFERRFMEAWLAWKAGKPHHRIPLFFPWFTNPKNVVAVAPGMEFKNAAFIEELTARVFRVYDAMLTDGQQHFYDQKLTDLGDEVFQFYPTEPEEAFLHSGRPVFNQRRLMELAQKFSRVPVRHHEGIDVWEEPDEEDLYGIGVDTAEGLEHGDNSVVSVVSKRTGREVAQAAGKIAPHELARLVGIAARLYDTSSGRDRHLVVIERNNHGHAVISYAKEDDKLNLYRRQVKDQITDKETWVIGWDTNEKSKALVVSDGRRDIDSGALVPQSPDSFDELRTFVHGERGIMAAMPGKKDDRVIALLLASFAAKQVRPLGNLSLDSLGFV